MISQKFAALLACSAGLFVSSAAFAEEQKLVFPQPSPNCSIKQKVGISEISVDYSRPSVKGRKIFGYVVPFDKVWRTGANAATKLVFSTDVKLDGKEIPAGTYALMTIPGKDSWTVIINKGSEQWGAYKYDEKSDVARFQVTPVKLDKTVEDFTIGFDKLTETTANLELAWDKTEVPIKIEVSYIDKLTSDIEKEMASDDQKKPYFQAAAFYFSHGKDLKQAKEWIDKAVAEQDLFYTNYFKAAIQAKMGDKEGAKATSKHSLEQAEAAKDDAFIRLNHELQATL